MKIWMRSEMFDPHTPAVIFDNGSGLFKAGLSSDTAPRSVISSVIGRPRSDHSLVEASRRQYYVGEEAQALRGILNLTYPIEHGIVTSWSDMEKIWQHMYNCELHIQSSEMPLLLTEPPLNPTNNREMMAEVMFESFSVPAMYVALQSTLSLYASGRTSGLVMDIGDGVTNTFPIFEGFHLHHAGNRLNVAGRDITEYFTRLLTETGLSFVSSSEKETARTMKENLCYVALDPKEEMGKDPDSCLAKYTLPDGKVITVGDQRFRAPEILFTPSKNGVEAPGVHTMIYNSILSCNLDIRRPLFENILLSGGSTLFQGFEDRVHSEVTTLAPETVKVKVIAPSDREIAAWIGGAVLTNLESFKDMWITAMDYKEHGVTIVHQKGA
ncbi:actin-related protein T2 [Hyla sarda]|uniref:actin-related protein T2 n=1 Tax=Hyla sarda TaxID=327740 RepID=UPI0024C34006|nr:actin-related protein T2 [Hyla sarda]